MPQASTERTYDLDIEAVPIPATMVYAHHTRMADFDSPAIERIQKPVSEVPRHGVQIRVFSGESKTRAEHHPQPAGGLSRVKDQVKRALHRRIPAIELGERTALDMRFSFMGNYAHLIHDLLGPLQLIHKTLAADSSIKVHPIHVVLPKEAPPLALKVLAHAGVPTIATDGVLRGQHVSITQELNIALLPHLADQPMNTTAADTPERVFVSRRAARSLLNEDEVTRFLAKEGFERFYMEDLSVGDQWQLLGQAREVVGIHGAGLSSLGFSLHCPKGDGPRFRLVELFSPGFSSTCFRDYAAVLGGTWVGVRGKITPEIVRDLDVLGHSRAHDNASFDVDIESLAEALADSRSREA